MPRQLLSTHDSQSPCSLCLILQVCSCNANYMPQLRLDTAQQINIRKRNHHKLKVLAIIKINIKQQKGINTWNDALQQVMKASDVQGGQERCWGYLFPHAVTLGKNIVCKESKLTLWTVTLHIQVLETEHSFLELQRPYSTCFVMVHRSYENDMSS